MLAAASPFLETMPCPVSDLKCVFLSPADLDRLMAFHESLHEAEQLPEGSFVRETRPFFARHLDFAGHVLGLLERNGAIAAYSVFGTPAAEDPDNFGRDIGMPSLGLAKICHFDGTGVAKARRGLKLQRYLTRCRQVLAQRSGRPIALSTVAPRNTASLVNMLAENMRVVALIRKYDSWRFVLKWEVGRVFHGTAPADHLSEPVLLSDNLQPHLQMLDEGWCGYQICRTANGVSLRYLRDDRAKSV